MELMCSPRFFREFVWNPYDYGYEARKYKRLDKDIEEWLKYMCGQEGNQFLWIRQEGNCIVIDPHSPSPVFRQLIADGSFATYLKDNWDRIREQLELYYATLEGSHCNIQKLSDLVIEMIKGE